MADLLSFVIPKIQVHWSDLAYHLKFEYYEIKSIKETHQGDLEKCCKKLLEDWLYTNKGVGPKTWPILLAKLEEITDLIAAVEDIKTSKVTIPLECH